jgi:hypothetical protein
MIPEPITIHGIGPEKSWGIFEQGNKIFLRFFVKNLTLDKMGGVIHVHADMTHVSL